MSYLIDYDKYLEAGVHIGTRTKVSKMRPYIFKVRKNALYVLDIKKTDAMIRAAGKMLAGYEPNEILVIATRDSARHAAAKFAEATGAKTNLGRFIPGRLTNVKLNTYSEPSVVIISDTKAEHSAVLEAAKMGIAVVAFCDTDNSPEYVDVIIPANNKGRKANGLLYYLLAREIQLNRGIISKYEEFPKQLDEFVMQKEERPQAAAVAAPAGPAEAPKADVPAPVEKADDVAVDKEKPKKEKEKENEKEKKSEKSEKSEKKEKSKEEKAE
ncbi:30S ribosomal protein S2 [Candidatus Micrarchaeota archaeon CG08_land_8_20_14_0_20_49_17]|nr:MAG: 30S ribosomal protein S2 [Candidatus Micrarchaeota archaeon CG1_02_49_24]PIU09302.1 MAG: 30S ribosomal protein S2 [Candidatus Micrarchaeota archaeon CG08_land_8_20_14_0_20_49_17]PIZ96184.1 MAG: 30S ribosomal protein S2 [Candidatus Micrarchaeota archaeon CG_4_10_14_0_2_um_filter_49_7]HII53920.1 30S ribosomal protein S2 [Candidatus Micrarchaeota archaeon]